MAFYLNSIFVPLHPVTRVLNWFQWCSLASPVWKLWCVCIISRILPVTRMSCVLTGHRRVMYPRGLSTDHGGSPAVCRTGTVRSRDHSCRWRSPGHALRRFCGSLLPTRGHRPWTAGVSDHTAAAGVGVAADVSYRTSAGDRRETVVVRGGLWWSAVVHGGPQWSVVVRGGPWSGPVMIHSERWWRRPVIISAGASHRAACLMLNIWAPYERVLKWYLGTAGIRAAGGSDVNRKPKFWLSDKKPKPTWFLVFQLKFYWYFLGFKILTNFRCRDNSSWQNFPNVRTKNVIL